MFDDTPFKLNKNIQKNINIKETTSGKKTPCEKYDEETNDVLTKFVTKHLKDEDAKLFSKINNNKLHDFEGEIYQYYDDRIRLCDEAIPKLDKLLELQDLFDFNIDIKTIKNLKTNGLKYKNPDPLNIKDKTKNLQLAVLLIEDDLSYDAKDWPIIKDSNSIENIKENFKRSKSAQYWQFTYEIALQLSQAECDLKKFFEPPNKLVKSFITNYQKELCIETDVSKKPKKFLVKNGKI